MKTNKKWYQYGVLASMGVLMLAAPASAKVNGQCAICHTMHNSQDNAPMALDAAGDPQEAPNEVLLLRGCVACHTGTNDGTNVIPYVSDTVIPTYGADGTTGDTLAGGTFYWVATQAAPGGVGVTADSTGHNVATDAMASQDAVLLNMPPGYNVSTGLTAQLRCAGVNGCHGDPLATSDFAAISGSHHANDTEIDGSTTAKSFRFLLGTLGLEDSDWEYQPTTSTHNQYKGKDRLSDSITENDTSTISSLCARCHNDYHNGTGNVGGTNPSAGAFASPWVRHPTDFDMSNTATDSDYRNYGGEGVNEYKVSAPVASSTIGETPLSSITFTNDDAVVTCISCHRAHGTQYADLLRWDYSAVAAGVGGVGACFECHTTK